MSVDGHALTLLAALVGTGALLHASRSHSHRSLPFFLYSWLSLIVISAAKYASLLTDGLPRHPYRFVFSAAIMLAAGLHLSWVTRATLELSRQSITEPARRRLMILPGSIGLLAALSMVRLADHTTARAAVQEALPLLESGVAFSLCSWSVFRQRASRAGSPFSIFAGLFGSMAVLQLVSGVLAGLAPNEDHQILGTMSLILQSGCALGVLIALLEDERDSAATAATEVERLAYYDHVTALPNRPLFFDRLAQSLSHASRHQHKLALLFVDIDRFKVINDSLGHAAGDALLKTTAQRIQTCLRGEDTIARFGGDEMIVLVHILSRLEDAGKIAQKIAAAISAPTNVMGREIVITSSIGIAVYPLDGTDGETLVKHADTAMYRAKEEGRDGYQYYSPAMNARALETLEMETALRQAVSRDELVLHYQPLIDVDSGTIFGLEALVRWNHPQQGLLLPDRFISLAESSGLIVSIGDWVLGEACRQAKRWQRRRGGELVMAVNLSARQCQQPDLVERVQAALLKADLRPELLELEITESHAMADVERTIDVLRRLKSLGVRIAIDDFGTGYSSLSYLKQFPVDTLKLDQSFVREITLPQDGAIARGVIAMAHSLNLKVVAEGVETLGQLDFLKSQSCDRLQGFLFSRPLAPAMFDKYLSKNGRVMNVA
ncbi:MAG TPA: EAL domain-containing protein [Thermoanaerobaculia bacterium]|nr:EAL domain-containing protein [Thermoanaerobaculia bacterium]